MPMTPECRNCNSHVTETFVRVMSRDGKGVDVCPFCPETVRGTGAQPRDAKAPRGQRYQDGD